MPNLSNGASLNDLQWPFQGHDYSVSNNFKMVQHTAIPYNGGPIESRIWFIERRHFQWPWTTRTPSFKVTPFFDAEYFVNGTAYRHSFNEMLIGTIHALLNSVISNDLEWLRKIFSDTKRRAVSLRQLSFLCWLSWLAQLGMPSISQHT